MLLVDIWQLRQQSCVKITGFVRKQIKAGRKHNALWVKLVDIFRLLPSGEGRSRLWTAAWHRSEIHQTSPRTAKERYPELFDLAKRQLPAAAQILSFGCSTGEELASLRERFPLAHIIGAEINGRSRRIAKRMHSRDTAIAIVSPRAINGEFDAIFALAVLQREPFKIAEMDVADLGAFYPFERFDRTVSDLVLRLRPGGILCVANAQYRVEDSRAAHRLKPIDGAPYSQVRLFAANGKRLVGSRGATMFVKL